MVVYTYNNVHAPQKRLGGGGGGGGAHTPCAPLVTMPMYIMHCREVKLIKLESHLEIP